MNTIKIIFLILVEIPLSTLFLSCNGPFDPNSLQEGDGDGDECRRRKIGANINYNTSFLRFGSGFFWW